MATSQGSGILDAEIKTFNQQKERLLANHEGEYVLIHGDKVIGTYTSEHDAVNEGYRQLGNTPFLVKQLLTHESPLSFTNNNERDNKFTFSL